MADIRSKPVHGQRVTFSLKFQIVYANFWYDQKARGMPVYIAGETYRHFTKNVYLDFNPINMEACLAKLGYDFSKTQKE